MKFALGRLTIFAMVLIALAAIQSRGEPAFACACGASGGTEITNTASATWQDNRGDTYQISSNQITATVQAISALAVTPKESAPNASLDGYPAGSNVTKTFLIANASNIPDAYRITALTADKGRIVSAAFQTSSGAVPVTVGSTVSPPVQPGESISLQVIVDTTGITPGSSFAVHVTAQTTASAANGSQSDSGEQWLVAATPSIFAGPSSPDTPVQKTVDQQVAVQAQPSGIVTYQITVKNYGGTAATHAVLADTVPDGLIADASSTLLNGSPVTASLSGRQLSVPLGTIAAGQTDVVQFTAHVGNATTLGSTYVNVASISADGIPPVSTTPASVFVGTANVVFDPVNSNRVVGGATVSLLDAVGSLVNLNAAAKAAQIRSGAPVRPMNSYTQNPLTTGADGTYGFALQASQIATGGSTFYLTVSAPGYLNRRIQLLIVPQPDKELYSVTYTSTDGQPVAQAGAYTLTNSSVHLADVFGIFGNVPLFKKQTITVSKIANRSTAEAGDRLLYTIDVANASGAGVGPVTVVDTLPAGEAYAPGTARTDGTVTEPAVNGRTLTWTFPSLPGGGKHEIVYACVVFPTVPGGTMLSNSVRADAAISGTNAQTGASANADVEIVDGALSDRSVLMGRVFADGARTGRYERGDRGIAGVRIYLEDGTSVVTDSEGRFTFPSVRPGMHVLRIDRETLAPGMRGGTLQRLVHGLLDDGLMQDVEFPIEASP
jgi:uncharacterized repeat protein (TIGR01451 family)